VLLLWGRVFVGFAGSWLANGQRQTRQMWRNCVRQDSTPTRCTGTAMMSHLPLPEQLHWMQGAKCDTRLSIHSLSVRQQSAAVERLLQQPKHRCEEGKNEVLPCAH
jgi:hypothetical protein